MALIGGDDLGRRAGLMHGARSIQMARWQTVAMLDKSWLTMTMIFAFDIISRIRRWAFSWNVRSPAESTSSTIRISGSMAVAIENASRTNMPAE